MLWMLLSTAAIFLILLLPLIVVEEYRNRWLRHLGWIAQAVDAPTPNNSSPRLVSRPGNVAFSKVEADAFRESFLSESLRMFTVLLTPGMLTSGTKDSELTTSPDKNNSVPSPIVPIPRITTDGTEKNCHDIETGLGPSGSQQQASSNQSVSVEGRCDDRDDEAEDDINFDNSGQGAEGRVCGLPLPGECRQDFFVTVFTSTATHTVQHCSTCGNGEQQKLRDVANVCVICLSPFHVDERISWSSNPACEHIFHHSCIMNWMKTSGSKYLNKVLRDESRGKALPAGFPEDPVKRLMAFPMTCPCCRQIFILPRYNEANKENPEDQLDSQNEQTESVTSGSDENDQIVMTRTIATQVAANAA